MQHIAKNVINVNEGLTKHVVSHFVHTIEFSLVLVPSNTFLFTDRKEKVFKQ